MSDRPNIQENLCGTEKLMAKKKSNCIKGPDPKNTAARNQKIVVEPKANENGTVMAIHASIPASLTVSEPSGIPIQSPISTCTSTRTAPFLSVSVFQIPPPVSFVHFYSTQVFDSNRAQKFGCRSIHVRFTKIIVFFRTDQLHPLNPEPVPKTFDPIPFVP